MRKYFYIGKRLALELNGAQARSILYGMECVLSELDRNELSTSTLLLAANRENSVLKANLTRSYSAYGFDDLTSRESLIGFNGEARDNVVGCDLLGNGRRAYSPVLMRFLSPDIMSPFEEGGLNAYMYCEGDPINYSDPSGMGRGANNNQSTSTSTVSTVNKTIKKNKSPRKSRTAASGGSGGSSGSTSSAKRSAPTVKREYWEKANDNLGGDELASLELAETMVDSVPPEFRDRDIGISEDQTIAGIDFKIRKRGASFTVGNGWVVPISPRYKSRRSELTALGQEINIAVESYEQSLAFTASEVSSTSFKSHKVRKNK